MEQTKAMARVHARRAARTNCRASGGEALDDFAKFFFPRGHQGKWRPIRPAFLAKGRSDATEFEILTPERLGMSLVGYNWPKAKVGGPRRILRIN